MVDYIEKIYQAANAVRGGDLPSLDELEEAGMAMDRLKISRDKWRDCYFNACQEWRDLYADCYKRAKRLEREVECYHEVLEEIATRGCQDEDHPNRCDSGVLASEVLERIDLVRAAKGEAKHTHAR